MERTETVSASAAGSLDPISATAESALNEAQTMGESIGALVDALLDRDPLGPEFALLNAIKACLTRMHAAVDPAVQSLHEARH